MASVNKRRWTHNGTTKEAWAVRYFDEKGVRRSKTFDQKKAADTFKRKVEREIEDGTHVVDAAAATIGEVAKLYLENADQRVRDGRLGRSRLHWMEIAFRKHILPVIGARRFSDLTPADTEWLYRQILAAGHVSPATARQTVQALITMERFAFKLGAAKRSPLREGASDLRGIRADPIRTLTTEQVSLILRHVLKPRAGVRRRNAAMTACMIHLAACCGLRSGEIRALSPACVDFEIGEIRVRRSLTQFDEVKGPKTAAGNRNVPIPSHLASMLRDWIALHATTNDKDLLFSSIHNGPVRPSDIGQSWKGVLREVGLDSDDAFHFHALRHFAASWWIENGLPLPEVATMLGHSKVDMTLSIYAHALVRPNSRASAMERMAAALTQNPAADAAPVTQRALTA